MAIVTHGTTLAGFKAIMSKEGKSLVHAPWTVSDNDGIMYFYDANSTGGDHGYCPEDEADDCRTAAANQSFEAARLQYAAKGQGGLVVVLVCDIPDDKLDLDYSCHGDSDRMPNARSIACESFDPSWIVEIRTETFDQWDCIPALLCVWDNTLFNKEEIPQGLATTVDIMHEAGSNYALIESLYDFELRTVDMEEFIHENA